MWLKTFLVLLMAISMCGVVAALAQPATAGSPPEGMVLVPAGGETIIGGSPGLFATIVDALVPRFVRELLEKTGFSVFRRSRDLPAFFIDRTEVTVGAYDLCVRAKVCTHGPDADNPNFFQPDLPMMEVNLVQAWQYCRWKGKRLPTDAEWDIAAGATDGRLYPWGDQGPLGRANFEHAPMFVQDGRAYRFTHPVCSYPEGNSPYGLCDMAGNVAEWTAEAPEAHGQNAPSDEQPVEFQWYNLRGGSFFSAMSDIRAASYDDGRNMYTRGYSVGFRCAKDSR